MASLSFSQDRTSMGGQVVLNFGFSKLHIILCFGTWLLCLGAVAFEMDKSIAADFTILANMANLIQISFWLAEAESIHKQPTTWQKKIQEAVSSSLFTVASTSESYLKMTISPSWYLQRSMFMGFVSLVPFLSIAYIKNPFIAFLMLLLVLRTSLAMVRLWLSPDEVLYWEFQILSQVTGLTLCEETIPNLLELVFKVDPLGVKDGELAESRKEKDLMLEDQKSEKGEVKDDLLDDQDWEQVDSSSIYEEAHQNGR